MTKFLKQFFSSGVLLSFSLTLAFILPLIYWIYLAFVSQMIIVHDAVSFYDLGSILTQKGWVQYFKTGPNREPLYPWMISLSMTLAAKLSVPFQDVLKIFNILLLSATQFLTLVILKKLRICSGLIVLTIFYLGFSPAIINSILSLFSEGSTYPWVLLLILTAAKSFDRLFQEKHFPNALWGFLLGLSLIPIISVKAMFEIIGWFLFAAYSLIGLCASFNGHKHALKNTFILVLVALITCEGILFFYKSANQKYNGNFVLTDRGPWALYGNTIRRTQKLTGRHILATIAHVPSREVCLQFFNDELCQFSEGPYTERIGMDRYNELVRTGRSEEQVAKILTRHSFFAIITNLPQYSLMFFIEIFKMFFWETTHIGFVAYPDWLSKIFDCPWVSTTLNYVIAMVSLLAFLFLAKVMARNRKEICSSSFFSNEQNQILFSIFVVMSGFITFYSLIFMVPRHILPIAPLFIITISFLLQNITQRNPKERL